MKKIGLISDTHGYLDEAVFKHFEHCDEIWHAGDFGSMEVVNELTGIAGQTRDGQTRDGQTGLKVNAGQTRDGQTRDGQTGLKGVYGNIDGQDIRAKFPEQLVFMCEEVKVLMRHIGGAPPKYNRETKKELLLHRPQLFISGHSHILKIMFDDKINCLHMNPGAAGKQGWHKVRTLIRFVIEGKNMKDCEVIELGKR